MKIKRDYFEQIIVLEDDPRTRFNLGKFIVEEEGELEKIKSLTGNFSTISNVLSAHNYFIKSTDKYDIFRRKKLNFS